MMSLIVSPLVFRLVGEGDILLSQHETDIKAVCVSSLLNVILSVC